MMKRFLVTIFLLNALYSIYAEDEIIYDSDIPAVNHLARGFGDEIIWHTLQDALKEASQYSKPIFLLIHKTWCGACQNLKPLLSKSLKFKQMSEHFIMVNLEDDEEPSDKAYSPDGSYIPRLMYLNHMGEVVPSIYNENGNPKYKYYYSSAESVIISMEKAIEQLKKYEEEKSGGPDDEHRFDYLKQTPHIEVDYDQMNELEKEMFLEEDLEFFDDYHQEL